MKLPKNCEKLLLFLHKDNWYRIVKRNNLYELYKVIDKCEDVGLAVNHEFLAKATTPTALEEKVYNGKLK